MSTSQIPWALRYIRDRYGTHNDHHGSGRALDFAPARSQLAERALADYARVARNFGLYLKDHPMPNPNPYRESPPTTPDGAPAMNLAQDDTLPDVHERAPGLDGSTLDDLLRGRWVEGYESGRANGTRDARQAARRRFADVYDEGYHGGYGAGLREGHRGVGDRFQERVHALHDVAHYLRTLPAASPEMLREGLEITDHVLGGIIHEYNGGPSAKEPPRPDDVPIDEKAMAAEREHDEARRADVYRADYNRARMEWLKGYLPADED